MIRRPPRSTLFPYTTLFRSSLSVPESIDYDAKIPNNVDLSSDRRLQRALEGWQPKFMNWWGEMGPTLRTQGDRKSTRLNSSHAYISYAGFCLKKAKADAPST